MGLTDDIVDRRPLESAGNSGNVIEGVTLRDGRELILKRVYPERDWMSRATNDRRRLLFMWQNGLFDRLPAVIDHTTVAVELEDGAWNVFMRDVTSTLVKPDVGIDREDVFRVLYAMREMHDAFWGDNFPELCSLTARYTLLSPATAQRERQLGNHHGEIISRGWEVFPDLVSRDVANAILAISEQPSLLAEQLAAREHTLIHGDLRFGNIGFGENGVVLIDWGERVGKCTPAVELAWFIGFDTYRMCLLPDEVIAEFRALYDDRFEEVALQLGLIGGLVQLGGITLSGSSTSVTTHNARCTCLSCRGGTRRWTRRWRPGRPRRARGVLVSGSRLATLPTDVQVPSGPVVMKMRASGC